MRIFIAFALLTALTSCATLNEAECRSGDWSLIGFEDGAQGRGPEFIAQHREACADYGVVPDLAPYLAGREQGLRQYCTPQKAYELGRNARSVANVCPASQNLTLSAANERGREYRRYSDEIAAQQRNISEYEDQLLEIDHTAPGGAVVERSLRRSISTARFEILRLQARRAAYDGWK